LLLTVHALVLLPAGHGPSDGKQICETSFDFQSR
jgi:hypothetical protein